MNPEYFVIQIQEFTDSSKPFAKAIFEYADFEEALSSYYNFLASSVANKEIRYALCEIMNKYGDIDRKDFLDRQE